MDDNIEDDSFNAAMASIDIPTEAKKAKTGETLQTSNESEGNSVKKPSVNKSNCILVSTKQRGNPLLKSIINVPWEYDDIVPDYIVGSKACILYLSLRYHNLNPDYIHQRLKLLGKMFELRILLIQIDIKVSVLIRI